MQMWMLVLTFYFSNDHKHFPPLEIKKYFIPLSQIIPNSCAEYIKTSYKIGVSYVCKNVNSKVNSVKDAVKVIYHSLLNVANNFEERGKNEDYNHNTKKICRL